jgi:N-acyl-D-aspartate/D-glutamate deacylase
VLLSVANGLPKLRSLLPSLAALVLAASASACGPTYDVVIEGGRVMDPESGLDAVRNIGIVDGRIDVISDEPLEGARHIQAAGLVVAPGFVDLHRHGHNEQAYRLAVRDGVTTGLELEIGTADVEAWYGAREGGQLVNYGVSMGHIGARAVAMGDPVTGLGGVTTREPATEEQIAETERLIREGLAQGAIGVGLGSAYTPVAADAGVTAFIHMRGGLQGLDSTLTAARNVGAPLHVVHANSSGGGNIVRFLAMIEAAQSAGQDVTTEAYPYAASSTGIQAALFDNWETWEEDRKSTRLNSSH